MATTGAPPSGTRDFFGDDLRRRDAAIEVIRDVFETCGFDPLETPAFERLELLTGKYGEDEKLIFKIAKRGAKAADGQADLALRYDLTVPLARYVANRDFRREGPFRRYHIGPVWRADRPGRGRFREFFQCDVDILGAEPPLADAETILAATESLNRLGLGRFIVRLNSRRVLMVLMSSYGVPAGRESEAIAAIDKLLKIGVDGVASELVKRQLPETVVKAFEADQAAPRPVEAVIDRISGLPDGAAAYAEVRRIEELVRADIRGGNVEFDPFTARGLDYYTGPVFEIFSAEDPEALPLSIASGGRYDELIGMFRRDPVPACGASLGFERIMMLLDEPAASRRPIPEVVVTVWDDNAASDALALASELRRAAISTEVYVGQGSLKAQLKYAGRRGARVAVFAGRDERALDAATVRDLATGEQRTGPRAQIVELVRSIESAAAPS